jgi:hypothetical protein
MMALGGTASAQTFASIDESDFNVLAARFVAEIAENRPVRVAVIPNSVATNRLATAIASLKRPTRLRIDVADAASVDAVMTRLTAGAAQPATQDTAINAGHLLRADYILMLSPERSNRRTRQRLTLEFFDVKNARSLDAAVVDVPPELLPVTLSPPAAVPPRAFPMAPSAAPKAAHTPPKDQKPPRLWPSQKIAIISGYALSGVAAGLAWSHDRDVRDLRRQMQAVPAGSLDEFNRLKDDAHHASRTRDFWWSVAAGGAAVTTTYLIVSASPSPAIAVMVSRRF